LISEAANATLAMPKSAMESALRMQPTANLRLFI